MKIETLIQFISLVLSFSIISCHFGKNKELSISKLIPFAATYIEGDDGLKTYSLIISEVNGAFSAEEVSTDNYTLPKTFDTLKIQHLNESQILKTTQFLRAAAKLPARCDEVTSLTQELTIDVEGKRVMVKGNCDWKEASYFDLREALFKLKN